MVLNMMSGVFIPEVIVLSEICVLEKFLLEIPVPKMLVLEELIPELLILAMLALGQLMLE